jgi:A/G-specific adenine glycosylase
MRGALPGSQFMTAKGRRGGGDLLRDKTAEFQDALLRWFARHRRDLPWRRTATPYRVWISEILLQQTRVRTALSYFERFLKRFPNVRSLARASEPEVLELWAGLGYYARARNIRRAAGIIVSHHRGRFPTTMGDLLALPGIGRYTAGAILSIAFNQPVPIVDGNVRRLISRLHGIKHRRNGEYFWRQAAAWIPPGRASQFNQAVMELGALVCLPSGPLCPRCPVSGFCVARSRGIADRIPPPRSKRAAQPVRFALMVAECNGCILLSTRHPADFVPGEWGLPASEVGSAGEAHPAANALARGALGFRVLTREEGTVGHAITYRRIRAQVFRAIVKGKSGLPQPRAGYHWVSRSEAERFLTSSLYRKALRALSG